MLGFILRVQGRERKAVIIEGTSSAAHKIEGHRYLRLAGGSGWLRLKQRTILQRVILGGLGDASDIGGHWWLRVLSHHA